MGRSLPYATLYATPTPAIVCYKYPLQHLRLQSVPTRGIPLEYTHMGRCSCVCRHCGAMFWECEKLSPNVPEFKVKLYNVVGTRRYELPTPETIGAIVFGGITETEFDLIVEEHSRIPQRVNKLHPCYMSLQFPLLFIYGEEGYHKDMKLVNIPTHSGSAAKRMTMNMYYAYQIHDRLNHYNLPPRGGKLFQQYVVTAYCAVEQNRFDYIRQNQQDIRNELSFRLYMMQLC
ncbi:hypothetical protein Tco_0665409 [Tanacetum coccineum]